MHGEAHEWVRLHAPSGKVSVLEVGSFDVNGGVRHLFHGRFLGLDIKAGPGVDVVAYASTYEPTEQYDVVVCCEVLEHTAVWPQIVAMCGRALRTGGALIVTCAGPGRPPHGADGGPVGDEFYANVSAAALEAETSKWGDGVVREDGHDTRAYVVKRAS
jgi:SAM-dependent methyltransferase